MPRVKRQPEKFDVLDLYTAVGRDRGYQIGELAHIDDFLELVRASLKSSHTNANLLHGKRIEALFAHVAGALGECRFIKAEDAGEIFSTGDPIQPPDYRLILKSGAQMLVEVKNFHSPSPTKPFVLKRSYFEMLKRYADLQAVPLKIAVFFSKFNRWCLLSERAFNSVEDHLEICFLEAVAKSEMVEIGDAWIGTLPELRLELHADKDEAGPVSPDGSTLFTTRAVKLFCVGNELRDPMDKNIAFYLMRFGDWGEGESLAVIEDDKLVAINLVSRPASMPDDQHFAMIGVLSSMISAAYAEQTVRERKPIALDTKSDPEVFSARIPAEHHSAALPLWRFQLQPNWDFVVR
ncbi:hypothetical protein AB6Q13_23835 [Ralstonia solanacearum]|uniref:hypothetical protein n=1 Tax=Ralstonia solanacearum TaxID=305 RepID=UPI002304D78E|nr:hypothetical protein [Ralstonia solanacearum]MDB0567598.1 hypothetical protein [Ralstonia solanacearum]MDB0578848.1 hypothetical protein [Ralstonia solanacearum]